MSEGPRSDPMAGDCVTKVGCDPLEIRVSKRREVRPMRLRR